MYFLEYHLSLLWRIPKQIIRFTLVSTVTILLPLFVHCVCVCVCVFMSVCVSLCVLIVC